MRGEVTRQFDNKRLVWIRNQVSDMGGIEWQDTTYGAGRAAKWRASVQLRALMREYGGRQVSVSIININNTQRKLSGSEAPTIESLWAEMPVANAQHVGLRPKMAASLDQRTDWDEKLREAGLEWLARLAA